MRWERFATAVVWPYIDMMPDILPQIHVSRSIPNKKTLSPQLSEIREIVENKILWRWLPECVTLLEEM